MFPEPVETLFEARHRRSGAQMPGNKIYTLRREERSLIFDAIYQEIYIGKSLPGNIYQEIYIRKWHQAAGTQTAVKVTDLLNIKIFPVILQRSVTFPAV